jgi:hypothetical protein
MKKLKHIHLIAAFAAALALGPTAGWSTHVFTDRVSGEITATPISETIEVDHHVYRIKAGSLAARDLHGFSEGQKVELVLDGSPATKTSEVLKIVLHDDAA